MDWQVVKGKKATKLEDQVIKKKNKNNLQQKLDIQDLNHMDEQQIKETILSLNDKLIKEKLTQKLFEFLNQQIEANTNEQQIVITALALGKVGSKLIPLMQFMVINMFYEQLKQKDQIQLIIYDPDMDDTDIQFIHSHFNNKWKFKEININKENQLQVNMFNIYYMIHAEQFLYSFVFNEHIQTQQLKNMIVVGNSLDNYLNKNKLHNINEKYSLVFSQCTPLLNEISLPDLDTCYAAFNDTVLLSNKQ